MIIVSYLKDRGHATLLLFNQDELEWDLQKLNGNNMYVHIQADTTQIYDKTTYLRLVCVFARGGGVNNIVYEFELRSTMEPFSVCGITR